MSPGLSGHVLGTDTLRRYKGWAKVRLAHVGEYLGLSAAQKLDCDSLD